MEIPFISDAVIETPFTAWHSEQASEFERINNRNGGAQPNCGNSGNCGNDNQEEWERPIPFYDLDLPIFPVDVFPPWLRVFVEGLSVATQTPIDLSALLALAALAAAGARHVRVMARSGWTEPLNLFVVAALPPGNRKSEVEKHIERPLKDYERELTEAARDEIADAHTDYKALEARWEKAVKDCAKLDGDELEMRRQEAREMKRQIDAMPVPAPPQLTADDITSEELASKLSEQGGRMAIFSTEGGVFDVMAGRYASGSPNIDVYLKGHSGDTLKVNRRNRAEYIDAPALTLGLAVQPEVIRGLAGKPGFRGRGLVGRFLYALPPSNLGIRKIRVTPLTDEARHTYAKNLQDIARIQPYGSDPDQARLLKLSKDADDYLAAFEEEIEPKLGELGELGPMSDWGGKLAGAVVRIAGLLHLAENSHCVLSGNWPGEVSAETIKKAIRVGRYLIPHARAAYAEMGADPKIEGAKHVLRWLEKDGRAEITKREIYQGTKGRFKEVAALEPALAVLIEHNYIRPLLETQEPRRGRKASQIYEITPFLRDASHNSHNSHNSPSKDIYGNTGNCGNKCLDGDLKQALSLPATTPQASLERKVIVF